jgi:tetratricopeptide (TPR) repeat protein
MTRRLLAALAVASLSSSALAQDFAKPMPSKEGGIQGEIRKDSQFQLQFSAEGQRWASYTVYPPSGTTSVHVELVGTDNDVDVFMRHGSPMESWYQEADHMAATGLGDEILLVDAHGASPLQAGKYYLDVVRGTDQPVSAFQVTVRFDHVDAAAYTRRGSGRRSTGDFEGALGDYARASELDPSAAEPWRESANTRAAMPEPDRVGAARDFAKALELDASLDAAVEHTFAESGKITCKLAEDSRYRTYKLVVPEGCKLLRIVSEAKAQDVDLYLRYGLPVAEWDATVDHVGDSRRKGEQLVVDGATEPALLPGTYYLDVVRSGAPAPDEEIALSVSFNPQFDVAKDADYWFFRGYAASNKQADEVARDAFSKALEIKSEALTLFNRGVVLRRLQEYQASNADLDAALALDAQPSFLGVLLYYRGNNHRNLEDYPASERDLRAALAESPTDGDYHAALGRTLLESGDVSGAEASIVKGLELNPEGAFAHYELAMLLGLKGQIDQAVAAYERALELRPAYADEWDGVITENTSMVVSLPPGKTNYHTYMLYVPEGVTAVKVSTLGANHDVNLHARYGLPMRNWERDPDVKANSEAADEVLTIPTPRPGRYFLDVDRGGDAVGAFKVTVEFITR